MLNLIVEKNIKISIQVDGWKKLREIVLQIDGNKCHSCNRLFLNVEKLEEHHVHDISSLKGDELTGL